MTCKECLHVADCPNRNNYPFPFDIKQFCKDFEEKEVEKCQEGMKAGL